MALHRDRDTQALVLTRPDFTAHGSPDPFATHTGGKSNELLLCLAGFVTNNTWAPPVLSLLADNGDVLCVGTLYPTSSTVGNFTEATFLFQNNGHCIKSLNQATSLQFSPPDGQEGMMSFCVDKLELLLLPDGLNETLTQTGQQIDLHLTFSQC